MIYMKCDDGVKVSSERWVVDERERDWGRKIMRKWYIWNVMMEWRWVVKL